MFEADVRGERVTVSQLAQYLQRKLNTISGHISDLAKLNLVQELMRGQWELTTQGRRRAQQLQPAQPGIIYRGFIAAGPAIPITQALDEHLDITGFDPANHFAMRVKGHSMVSFNILDGDLIILRQVTNWLEVPEGKIVAAYVPEGTDIHHDDWQEQLERTAKMIEGGQEPILDHVTLKKLDVHLRSYLRQGIEQQRIDIKLKGSQGTMYPIAISIAGIAVYQMRDLS